MKRGPAFRKAPTSSFIREDKTNNRQRPHQATATQIESWEAFKDSPQRQTQKFKILTYLSNRQDNSRGISKALNIERTATTRSLRDLQERGRVHIAKEAKCPITGRRTQFYGLADQDAQPGVRKPTSGPKCIQLDLFKTLPNAG